MATELIAVSETGIRSQAENDEQVVGLWLYGRGLHTQKAYREDITRLLDFAGCRLTEVTLAVLQAYANSLEPLADTTRNRKLSAVKSLLSFAHRIGYTQFNVGAALRAPSIRNRLAERILSEAEVQRVIALEPNLRNHVLLTLLYASGGRVSELCALKWKDTMTRSDGGQLTLFGKGGKTRAVLLSSATWQALQSIHADASPESPVFLSRKGGHLDVSQVHRVVRAAARRSGLDGNVSAHWFRHAHASHALDRGCPVHIVQSTLGHASLITTSKYAHARPNDSSARYLAV